MNGMLEKGGADGAARRRRLAWRCRRGLRELELLLEAFLADGYERLDVVGRRAFEQLLEAPDPDLLAWLLGEARPQGRTFLDVVERIRRTVGSGA